MGSIPDVQGYHNVRVVANPGAGNDFNVLPIAGVRMRILGLRFTFVADATVITRLVHLQLWNGVTVCSTLAGMISHAASETRHYSLWPGFSAAPVAISAQVLLPWTPLVIVDNVYYLGSAVEGMQAGDAITDIAYATEEWISEP